MATEAIIYEQIVDMNWDQAIYTASPNNTINVAQFAAKGSGTNIGIALTPKGTGYISGHAPDGTAAGGNARGQYAVDLQIRRVSAGTVASGLSSAILGGYASTASGEESLSGQRSNNASGQRSIALGGVSNASAFCSVAIGDSCNSSADVSWATGSQAASYLRGMRSHGCGRYPQEVAIFALGTTTTNVEVILKLPTNGNNVALRSNHYINGILQINGCKLDGSATACYTRQVRIRRVGNVTTLLSAAATIGVDDAAGTSITITANDATESLNIGVTGIAAETWDWSAMLHGLESPLDNL